MPSWEDIKSRFSPAWKDFSDAAERQYASIVEASFESVKPKVQAALGALVETQEILNRMGAKITELERLGGGAANQAWRENYQTLLNRFHVLAAGVLAGSEKVQPQMGGGPLVVAGIILAVAGVCFAVAAYEYCLSLRDQAKLQEKELDARVEAMRAGTTLPGSTLPPPPKDPVDQATKAIMIVAVAGVVGVGIYAALPLFLKPPAR